MASGKINVSTSVLTTTADTAKKQSAALYNKLEEIYRMVKKLEASYDSKSGRALISGFEKNLRKHFADYKAVVDSYAEFLVKTAQQYETLEQTLTGNADSTTQFSQPS